MEVRCSAIITSRSLLIQTSALTVLYLWQEFDTLNNKECTLFLKDIKVNEIAALSAAHNACTTCQESEFTKMAH